MVLLNGPGSGNLNGPGSYSSFTLAEDPEFDSDGNEIGVEGGDESLQPSRINKHMVHRKFLELDLLEVAVKNVRQAGLKSAKTLHSINMSCTRVMARKLLQKRAFVLCTAGAIVLNAVFVGVETDLSESTLKPEAWYAMEVVFTVGFAAELLVRFAAASSMAEFTLDRWNVFDLALVVLSCVDNFLLTPLLQGGGQELVVLNSLRMIRLLRLARMVRLIRLFRELWVLVAGIIEAVWTLVWAWVLLGLLVYVFGIFATRTIGHHPSAESDPMIFKFFGTLPRSMFTLFSITTTEGWSEVARTCMAAQGWTWVLFIAYLYVTTFAVMNVVVAVIVENTLDQAGAQRERFLTKQREAQHASCVKIYKVFCDADTDGNGVITKDEFVQEIQRPEVQDGLKQLGIDIRQAENLFGILDYDDSHSLDAEEFVGGMLKAVGMARAKDVLAVDCDSRRAGNALQERLNEVAEEANRQMTMLEKGVQELTRDLQALVEVCSGLPGRGGNRGSSIFS